MKGKVGFGLTVALVVVLLVGMLSALPVGAQTRERFKWLITDKFTVLEGGAEFQSTLDLDGNELTLDADADSSLTADTDDQLDLELSGADEYVWTATAYDINANELILDADQDTSITADTDDRMDFRLGGADIVFWNEWGASDIVTDTTEHLVEIVDATPVITGGTVSLSALNIDLGIGNSTAGTNTIYGILVDGITQDAQNTETAIAIGNGWDRGIDMDGTPLYMDNDQDSYFSELADDQIGITPGAAAGLFSVRSGNLTVGDGTPDVSQDGEDAYVEGTLEVDGAATFDGVIDQNIDIENVGNLPTIDSASVITTATDGALWTVADGEIWFVYALYCVTTESFACDGDDCALIIGDGNDTDGLLVMTDGELQLTDAEFTGAPANWHGLHTDSMGAYLSGLAPFVYAPSGAAETIDVDVSGTNIAGGTATCYLVYTRVQ